MNKFIIYLGLFLIILFSCEKENVDIDFTVNNWKVVKIKKPDERSYSSTQERYILKFYSDSTCSIVLDRNTCWGDYKNISNGNIEFEVFLCTMVCCDSDFADDLVRLFPEMSKYYGKGNELIFEGHGEIILEKD